MRTLGVWLIAAKAFAVVVAFDPRADVPFALPKAMASHALAYALFLALALYLLPRRGRPFHWSPVYLPVGALAMVYFAASALAMDLPTALFGAGDRYLGLVTFLDGVALSFAVAVFVRTERDLLIVGGAVAISAVPILLYGFLQALGRDPIAWDIDATSRIFSTFGNAGPLASYLVTVAAGATAFLAATRGRLGPRTQIALVAYVGALLLGVFLAGTRGAVVAIPPAAIAVGLFSWRAGMLAPRRVARRVVVGASGAALVILLVGLVLTPAGRRLADLVQGGDTSTRERALIYATALEVVRARPLLGVGPDNFIAAFPGFRPADAALLIGRNFTQSSTHSSPLKVATDAGLLGLGAYLALVATLLWVAWRRARLQPRILAVASGSALVAYLAQSVVTINDIGTEWLFWLVAGLLSTPANLDVTATAAARPRGRRSERRAQPLPDDRPLGATVLLGALGAALVVSTALSSSELAKASFLATLRGDTTTGVRAGQEATGRDGGRGDHWNVLGIAQSARGASADARASFLRAAAATPYEPRYLLNAAEEETHLVAAGKFDFKAKAMEHAAAAVRVSPNDPDVRFRAGRVLFTVGEPALALEDLRRAVELFPDAPDFLFLLSRSLEATGDRDAAIRTQHKAVELDPSLPNRLRLAQLYAAAGDFAQAQKLIAPPHVIGADRNCIARYGGAPLPSGGIGPRCFRIVFESEGALIVSGLEAEGAVTNPENYRADGRPLDLEAIQYDARALAVTLQLGPTAVPPRASAAVSVLNVRSVFGSSLAVNTATLP